MFGELLDAVRKVALLLGGLFPWLERAARAAAGSWERLASRTRLRAAWTRLRGSSAGEHVARIVHQFWWPQLSGGRIDLARVPSESRSVLRAALVTCGLLCALLPAAVSFGPVVQVSTASAAGGPVAAWVVPLWGAALGVGWGALLAGAGASNRAALLLAAATALWALAAGAGTFGRSAWSASAAAVPLAAYALSERRLRRPGRRDAAFGLACGLAVGAASGVALIAFTPLARAARGHVVAAGIGCGLLLGAAAFAWARRAGPAPGVGRTAALLSGLVLLHVGALGGRGGLAGLAGTTLDFLTVWSGYLWPVRYFLGVGLVYKALSSSSVVAEAVGGVLPRRWIVPLGLAALAAAGALLWLPAVFDAPGVAWPRALVSAAAAAWRAGAPWIWGQPVRAEVAQWLRWILLADGAAVAWLAARRRLDAAAVLSLLLRTLFACWLVAEYLLQQQGLTRSGPHTALALLLFSIWALWLFNGVGLKLGTVGSPRWPAPARTALHAGLLVFVLLSLHARAAARDPLVASEIFLDLFRGAVDVGLPFAMLVWARRALGDLPLPTGRLLVAFLLGAALSAPLAALDKLVVAGGSWRALGALLDARLAALLAGAAAQRDLLPPAWIAARGLLAVAAMGVGLALLARRLRGAPGSAAAQLFAAVAAFCGLEAFSRARVDLPLVPPRWSLLVSPARPALDLDADVLASWLAYALPGLVLGLALSRPGGPRRRDWAGGLLAAAALHLACALAWPAGEAWLRSTEVLPLAALGAGLLAVVLVRAARRRAQAGAPEAETSLEAARCARSERRLLAIGAGLGAALLVAVGAGRAIRGRLTPRGVPRSPAQLLLPAGWQEVPSRGEVVVFARRSAAPAKPLLSARVQPGGPGGAPAVLERMVAQARAGVPGFEPRPVASWERWSPGAAAVDYAFEVVRPDGTRLPLAGTTAVLPLPGGDLLVLDLAAALGDWHARRWDLVRAAQAQRAAAEVARAR